MLIARDDESWYLPLAVTLGDMIGLNLRSQIDRHYCVLISIVTFLVRFDFGHSCCLLCVCCGRRIGSIVRSDITLLPLLKIGYQRALALVGFLTYTYYHISTDRLLDRAWGHFKIKSCACF